MKQEVDRWIESDRQIARQPGLGIGGQNPTDRQIEGVEIDGQVDRHSNHLPSQLLKQGSQTFQHLRKRNESRKIYKSFDCQYLFIFFLSFKTNIYLRPLTKVFLNIVVIIENFSKTEIFTRKRRFIFGVQMRFARFPLKFDIPAVVITYNEVCIFLVW